MREPIRRRPRVTHRRRQPGDRRCRKCWEAKVPWRLSSQLCDVCRRNV